MLHLDLKHIKSKLVVVAFHTNKWIQHLITNLRRKLPGERILIINNNPKPGEHKFNRSYPVKFIYNDDVAEENEWLGKNSDILDIIEPENRNDLTHGAGLDLARKWCLEHGWLIMTHVEPDCCFSNLKWYYEQLEAIKNGYWMASSFIVGHYEHNKSIPKAPLGIYASTILIKPTLSQSMKLRHRGKDQEHRRYKELVGPKYSAALPSGEVWDTGHAVWFHCAIQDRAIFIPSVDIWHLGNATLREFETKKRKSFVPKSIMQGPK